MNIEDIKRKVHETKMFSPATVEYWFEWLQFREQVPPTVEEAVSWMQDMELCVGESFPDMIPASWITDD
jgi:hypothetical protein